MCLYITGAKFLIMTNYNSFLTKSELMIEVLFVSSFRCCCYSSNDVSGITIWRLWKLTGVFEWHENQVLISKFFRLDVKRLNFPGIFLLHFINGGSGGVGYCYAYKVHTPIKRNSHTSFRSILWLPSMDSYSGPNTQTHYWTSSMEPPIRQRSCIGQSWR